MIVEKLTFGSRHVSSVRYNTQLLNKLLPMTKQQLSSVSPKQSKRGTKQPSLLWNLIFNLILPTVILTKLSGDTFLGIKLAIVVALSFPIIYFWRDLIISKKINFFSGLGIVSISLTGSISLLELDASYIAIKEAAIPAMLGIAIMLSTKTSQPLIHTFLLNKSIINIDLVAESLHQTGNQATFDKVLMNASWFLAASFALSAILNYVLAVVILTADPGTEAFNQQLGKMTALSFPVIAVPLTVILTANLMYVFRGITRLTGLTMESILNTNSQEN